MYRRQFQMGSLGLLSAFGMSRLGLGKVTQGRDDGMWPGWRGPSRDGHVAGGAWPDSLQGDHLTQEWTVSLDAGYSGPLVTSQSVIVTETLNKEYEVVRSLDRLTGKEEWRKQWKGSMSVPFFAKSNGDWIRSTPATDGKRVYVGGMRDVLASFELGAGQEGWRIDFAESMQSPIPDFGMVCSPLIDGDFLYVQAGGGLVKVARETGKVEWRVLNDGGGMNGSAFSSPVFAELHGRRLLLVQTRTTLYGLEAADGAVVWQKPIEAFRGMNILTPTVWKDTVFTSSYGGKAWLFGFEPTASGEWKVNTLWENKVQAYMSSPVVIGDTLYLHLRNQRFTAIDLKTGKEHWTSRPYGKYWSMVTNGERILALDEKGILYLIAPNPEAFTILDERKVSDEECWAHLAVVDSQVVIRDLKGVTSYRWT